MDSEAQRSKIFHQAEAAKKASRVLQTLSTEQKNKVIFLFKNINFAWSFFLLGFARGSPKINREETRTQKCKFIRP